MLDRDPRKTGLRAGAEVQGEPELEPTTNRAKHRLAPSELRELGCLVNPEFDRK